jgi:signal transduction histidine kinase
VAWAAPPAQPEALLEVLSLACALLGAALAPPPGEPAPAESQSALELRALQSVAEATVHLHDLGEVLGRCLDLAIEVAHASSGGIWLRDEARGSYTFARGRNLSPGLEGAAPPIALVDARLSSGGAHVVDLPREQGLHPSMAASLAAGKRRLVVVPLVNAEQRIGLLSLAFPDQTAIDPSTLRTLEAIAGHEAAAIGRARAQEALARRSRLAMFLREYAMRVLATARPEAQHQLIIDTAQGLLRADGVVLARIAQGAVEVLAGQGTGTPLLGISVPIESPGVAEFLAREGAVVVEDVATLPEDSTARTIARLGGVSSFAGATLRDHGRTVGYLSVSFITRRGCDPEEIEALELLAAMAAAVLVREEEASAAALEYALLGSTIEHLPLVVALIGHDGSVLNVNAAGRAFAERFGTGGESWTQSMYRIRTCYPDGRPVPPEEALLTRALAGENPPPTEYLLIDPSGTQRVHALAVAAPVQRDGDGRVRVVVTGFQDVSTLRELAESKDRFLRIASHELRSPITSLRATTALLEMDPAAVTDPARRQVLLDRIKRQIDRLIALVEQLLDSARINAQALPLLPAEHDLCETVREAVGLASAGHPTRTVEIEAPPRLIAVYDPQRLEQVITNLVSNALRYSPPDSPVTVRVGGETGGARIEVIDRGMGIDPAELPRLFTPFFRASGAAVQHKGGLGLGLHIAHEIVRRHGGNLEVASEPGRGSTFTVHLPR